MSRTMLVRLALILLVFFLAASCDNIKSSQTEKKVRSDIDDKIESFEGCLDTAVLTEEKALESLKVLAVGDHETIGYYRDFEDSDESRFFESEEALYENDVCSAIKILSFTKNKEAYGYILSIVENKKQYPKAVVCAIRAVMTYGEFRNGYWIGNTRSIPSLMKVVNSNDPDVRLTVSGALLSLGAGDIALPVLDDIIRAGNQRSISAINKLFAPEEKKIGNRKRIVRSDTRLFDKRGGDILLRALDNPNNEVKIAAASKLAGMGIEKKRAEQTAVNILEKLKNKKPDDYERIEVWIQDREATYRAVALLGRLNTAAGNAILKELSENDKNKSLQERAQFALSSIQQD